MVQLKKVNSNLKKIFFILLMLYTILPVNYYFKNLSYANGCAVVIVALYFITTRKYKIINIFKQNFFYWFYLILYGIFAFCTANSTNGIAWLVSKLLVSLILIQIVSCEEDLYYIIKLILISSVILSVIGFFESFSRIYLFQSALFINWSDRMRYGILRCSGPFLHPINYALYQSIAALLAFYRINSNINKKRRKWYVFVYIMAISSMALAVSRLAICFFVAAQILMILQLNPKKTIEYLCMGLLVAVSGIIVLDALGIGSLVLINDLLLSFLKMLGLNKSAVNSNVIGFGNRFDLYKWVIDAVGKNYMIGRGIGAQFSYKMSDWFTKTSIEVHYLYIFYQCGLVGVTVLVLSYISTICYFWKKRKFRLNSEGKLSFLNVLLIMFIFYYISLFGVQETDLTRLYCVLVSLGIAYYRICYSKTIN